MTVPAHLPERLAITLWDFSWYTRAGAGEPYEDIDRAFIEAAERGYNTVRICAAPMLLCGELGVSPIVRIGGLGPAPHGDYYGRRTRWYDVPGGYEIDVRTRLLELFASARRHGFVVILASWEYQQSASFAEHPDWWNAMDAIPVADRLDRLASAASGVLSLLNEHGFADLVAFTELHNEIDFSLVGELDERAMASMQRVRDQHPGQLVTASWGKPPHLDMAAIPSGIDTAQFHIYSYGVLDALQSLIDLRAHGSDGFPNAKLRGLLRDDAPSFIEYGTPEPWKLEATVITDQMIYGYDWIDADRWDLWLYEHYALHAEAMRREIESRLAAVAAWSKRAGVPHVIGEGWIGYTPLDGTFEEGPVGRALAEHGIRAALANDAWGMVLCSNAAPHHPMWADVAWQQRMNATVLSNATG